MTTRWTSTSPSNGWLPIFAYARMIATVTLVNAEQGVCGAMQRCERAFAYHTKSHLGILCRAGLFMALQTHDQHLHTASLGCRSLNTYVTVALSRWSMDIGIQPSIPRQLRPSTMTRNVHAAGAGSFGMSGTNAHLVLNVLLPSNDIQPRECSWQRTRRVSPHNAIMCLPRCPSLAQ